MNRPVHDRGVNFIRTITRMIPEAKGFIEIIGNYAKSWALLQGYDEQTLQEVIATREQRFILDYDEAKAAIAPEQKEIIIRLIMNMLVDEVQ